MSDLISRQDAVDAIEMICNTPCNQYFVNAIKRLPSAEQQWIPCNERLPDAEEKTYWVCTDTEYQCQCRWTNANPFWTEKTTNWHWNIFDYPQYSKVVAWIPLPQPWKGEEDED